MEAFPATLLATADTVLASAIPAQLQHALSAPCPAAETMTALENALTTAPPALLLLDSRLIPSALAASLIKLREHHPLMAVVLIGNNGEEATLADIPLSAFCPRPIVMSLLLRQMEQLSYARGLRAGQQELPFSENALFCPAEGHIKLAEGSVLALTDKESALLRCLYHHRHGWLVRQQLLEEVWGYSESIATHTLETHLYRLRHKLREAFGGQELIVTRNATYRLML